MKNTYTQCLFIGPFLSMCFGQKHRSMISPPANYSLFYCKYLEFCK